MDTNTEEKLLLKRIRLLIIFFIFALVVSGITAFPLETEMRIACSLLGISHDAPIDNYTGLQYWIAKVYNALVNTNRDYPFLAYGYDWLAFAHVIIAIAFIGLYRKPVQNIWIVHFAMIACIAVIPLALICGEIRQIPFFWRVIDCSFGVFGIIPLYILHVYIKRLEAMMGYVERKY
ncbi:hypothetical protein CLV62_11920 [Dysgonomonas alginatilytica]|uniref:Uncharacterized protein n=1 Tax=Dysgonomonas alginatilytica TaxID=1605892 RepID=A0A2V3PN66_9BACT|nr:hypothetical protein [Dysgonomonas alginatilytica]PXV62480.1 hypothetical protein CLV62_11920 [Dysgonomonas alginatilytica]